MAYTTNYTLLEKLRRKDEVGWQEFYFRYAPFVAGIARARGFSEPECEEIIQLTMSTIFAKDALLHYQKDLGQFRAYLSGIVKNQLSGYRRKNPVPAAAAVDDAEDGVDSLTPVFDREYRRYLLQLMLDALRNQVEHGTFEAFYLTAVEGKTPEETAAMLQIPVSRVYTAKSRCLRHLRNLAREMQKEDPDFVMPFSE